MGVKGLATHLKRAVPEALRTVQLSSLSNRAVAIDGNVLTLRFHHSAESDHVNRHILNWYRFARRLRTTYNIRPIVVFDGANRVSAKQRELERRYRARALLSGRAESEQARVDRLTGLHDVVEHLHQQPIDVGNRILSQTVALIEETARTGIPLAPIDPSDDTADVGVRLATLVLDSQAKAAYETSEPGRLSKRQISIAQNEAKAFVQALSYRVDPALEKPPTLVREASAEETGAKVAEQVTEDAIPSTGVHPRQEDEQVEEQIGIGLVEADKDEDKLVVAPQTEDLEEETITGALEDLKALLSESKYVAQNYAKRASTVSKQTYTDCMEVLKAMGIPVLLTSSTEPAEAENLCSSLVAAGYADAVISEDTDVLVFEAPLLRGLGVSSREGQLIHGREVREKLGFTTEEWIQFCLLLGCDFTDRIKGVGPVNAEKLIRQYGSISEAINAGAFDKIAKSGISPGYMDEIEAARAIFLSPISVSGYTSENFRLKPEDPGLINTLKGFGLDGGALQMALIDNFANLGDGDYELDRRTSSDIFGSGTLSDSPIIPGGVYAPYPSTLHRT